MDVTLSSWQFKRMQNSNSKIKSSLSNAELAAWLALIRMPGVGNATIQKLNQAFPYLSALFIESESSLLAQGCPKAMIQLIQKVDWRDIEKDLTWAEEPYHYIVLANEDAYPDRLRQTTGAPSLLFVKGKLEVLQTAQLAIVGSRKPTPTGIQAAREFAEQLAFAGLTITSGLALGIDAAAHRAALSAGGQTIAVLGAGIDQIYPRSHQSLAANICEQGALVSEFPPGTPPLAEHFPRRNRIVSGLSLGTFVVEATQQSGSLITARLANEQGREVFAMPGSIYNPQAQGCHFLIKQGAKLVANPADILEELPPLPPKSTHLSPTSPPDHTVGLDEDQLKLIQCVIGYEPTAFEILLERSHLDAKQLAAALLKLELAGVITMTTGGYMRIA